MWGMSKPWPIICNACSDLFYFLLPTKLKFRLFSKNNKKFTLLRSHSLFCVGRAWTKVGRISAGVTYLWESWDQTPHEQSPLIGRPTRVQIAQNKTGTQMAPGWQLKKNNYAYNTSFFIILSLHTLI
jgi:hypothetical protein